MKSRDRTLEKTATLFVGDGSLLVQVVTSLEKSFLTASSWALVAKTKCSLHASKIEKTKFLKKLIKLACEGIKNGCSIS